MEVAPGTAVPVPEHAGDDGSAAPALRAAMAGGAAHRAVLGALVGTRLLVPVVAVLDESDDVGGEKDSHLASVELTAPDGRRALLAFTGVDAVSAWRADARPVPVRVDRVAASALADGVDAVLLDIAGPAPYELPRPDLVGLAAGEPYGPAYADPTVVSAIAAAVRRGLGPGAEFRVGPGVQGADAQVVLSGAEHVERVAAALAEDPTLNRHCPAGIALAIHDRPPT